MIDKPQMNAVVYTEYGSPEVLRLTKVDIPQVGNKEILVRVHNSSVTSGTIWMRKGMFPGSIIFTVLIRLIFGIRKPKRTILGFEFSGVVEDLGNDVTHFQIGDEVYGTTTNLKNGAYAEYVCVPEKWKHGVVTHKPKELTFEEAAVLPIGAMTALHLLQKNKIRPNDKVLVYGASGSVGTYGVQIAKYFGASVTGVCSTANLDLVRSIGADEVLDYTKEDFTQNINQYDVVFDAVGKLKSSQMKPLLKKSGRICSVKSITSEKVEYLDLLNKMVAENKLKPVIDKSYTMEQMVEAHKYVDLGRKRGNVSIIVAE